MRDTRIREMRKALPAEELSGSGWTLALHLPLSSTEFVDVPA